jgi:hypothetical protein
MKKDPLIEEIRAVRHRISARFGHDTKRLVQHYREMEKLYADRMLRQDRAGGPQPAGAGAGPRQP